VVRFRHGGSAQALDLSYQLADQNVSAALGCILREVRLGLLNDVHSSLPSNVIMIDPFAGKMAVSAHIAYDCG
jgi:hypothetical protein